MRLLDRIVLIIYSLVLSLISIVIIMMGFHILPEYYIKNFAYLFRTYRYIIGIIGIVFLILSIRVMLSGIYQWNRIQWFPLEYFAADSAG